MIPDTGTLGIISAFPWVLLLVAVVSAARGDWKSKSVVQEQLKQKDDVIAEKDKQIADIRAATDQRVADMKVQYDARLLAAGSQSDKWEKMANALLDDMEDLKSTLKASLKLASVGKQSGGGG